MKSNSLQVRMMFANSENARKVQQAFANANISLLIEEELVFLAGKPSENGYSLEVICPKIMGKHLLELSFWHNKCGWTELVLDTELFSAIFIRPNI